MAIYIELLRSSGWGIVIELEMLLGILV